MSQFPLAFWNAPYSNMRAHPDSKRLLIEAGVVDYWRQSGKWGALQAGGKRRLPVRMNRRPGYRTIRDFTFGNASSRHAPRRPGDIWMFSAQVFQSNVHER